jgi:hypothetical protein
MHVGEMYMSILISQESVLGQDPAILCLLLYRVCGSGDRGPDVTFPYNMLVP